MEPRNKEDEKVGVRSKKRDKEKKLKKEKRNQEAEERHKKPKKLKKKVEENAKLVMKHKSKKHKSKKNKKKSKKEERRDFSSEESSDDKDQKKRKKQKKSKKEERRDFRTEDSDDGWGHKKMKGKRKREDCTDDKGPKKKRKKSKHENEDNEDSDGMDVKMKRLVMIKNTELKADGKICSSKGIGRGLENTEEKKVKQTEGKEEKRICDGELNVEECPASESSKKHVYEESYTVKGAAKKKKKKSKKCSKRPVTERTREKKIKIVYSYGDSVKKDVYKPMTEAGEASVKGNVEKSLKPEFVEPSTLSVVSCEKLAICDDPGTVVEDPQPADGAPNRTVKPKAKIREITTKESTAIIEQSRVSGEVSMESMATRDISESTTVESKATSEISKATSKLSKTTTGVYKATSEVSKATTVVSKATTVVSKATREVSKATREISKGTTVESKVSEEFTPTRLTPSRFERKTSKSYLGEDDGLDPTSKKRRHSVSLTTPHPTKKSRFATNWVPATTQVNRSWQPKCAICKTFNHGTNDLNCPAFDANPSRRVCFKGPLCAMSNMFPCLVSYCENTFRSTEHAYQWKRAHDIGNTVVAGKILRAQDGFAAKRLSKELDKWKVGQWKEDNSIKVMKDLIREKYKQVEPFRRACVESGDAFLMEATWDTFWGIGLLEEAARNCKLEFLPGKNVLGWIIMQVRNESAIGMISQLQDLYNVDKGGRSTFVQGIGNVFTERAELDQGLRRQLHFSQRTPSRPLQNQSSAQMPKMSGFSTSYHTQLRFHTPDFNFGTRFDLHSASDNRDNIDGMFYSVSSPMSSIVQYPSLLNMPKLKSVFHSNNTQLPVARTSDNQAAVFMSASPLSDLVSPRRNEIFTFPSNQSECQEENECSTLIRPQDQKYCLILNVTSKDKKESEVCDRDSNNTSEQREIDLTVPCENTKAVHNSNANMMLSDNTNTSALCPVRSDTSSSDEQVDSDKSDSEESSCTRDEQPIVPVGFGGSNRKESFLARGPGGFNRDRQEVPRDDRSGRSGFDRDLKRKGEDEARYNKGPDDRDKFRDRSFDDRDSYLDPMEYNRRRDLAYYDVHRDHYSEYDRGGRRQDDRRDHDKKPESRDSRGNVPGDEWSGGGDAGEWQGGGGEMPAHMKKWTDPQESGDGTRGAKKDAGPAAVDRDQRWDTDNRQKNWNQPQQQQYGRSEGGTAKDVDYRQQWSAPPDSRDNRGVKDQRVEAENYNTSGWTEGQQDKQRQTVPYGQVEPKSEQYQQGEWSDPAKSSWQGGGNGSEEKRWEQQAAREEWSGGWASNEHQSAESAQRSDDKSQWSSEKYGTGYQEQGQQQQQQYPAYSTGYEGQRDQQYDSYSAGNQTAEKDQHGYAQQTHNQSSSQDWSQYSQQGWEGYGQGTGYGEWNQTQAVTTDSTESKASKTGNSASSQSQYSSWSEYKAAGSATTTEASNSAAAPQSGTNQYGHYSQTSTTANSAKDTQQAWESRNYGYDTQAQPTSANAYSHSTHGSSTANATPQINQASLLGAAANISLPPNLDLNAIQQSLAAHGFTQPPPPPPGPAPAPAAVLFPAVAAYQAGSGLAGIAPGLPHGAGMYPAVRRQ